MKRSTTCDDCKTVVRVGATMFDCGWPCSRFGYVALLGRRRIAARHRWLAPRGVYQRQPYP